MAFARSPRIAVGPSPGDMFVRAVTSGGGIVVPLEDDADALIWTDGPEHFPTSLPSSVRWVQLPSADVELWLSQGHMKAHPRVVWTSAAGAYARTVAEHALMLLLAGVRALPRHLAATTWSREALHPLMSTLRGATVGIVGTGDIGRALIPMLASLGARSVAVNRSGNPVPGAVETFAVERVDGVWRALDHVVVSATVARDSRPLIGRTELSALKPTSWLINVADGTVVDTDALVDALSDGTIAGAGLDAIYPEPLPDGHPLWSLPNAMVTPHDSNPPGLRVPEYLDRVTENIARFASGVDLLATIDIGAGY